MKPVALSSAILFAGVLCTSGMASAEDRCVAAFTSQRLADEGALPSFAGATTWLNGPSLTTDALRGKVVVVDFWTYTCINWLRTLPYARAWADKYRGQDLVVIGVHSPEFEFEKDLANVGQAATCIW